MGKMTLNSKGLGLLAALAVVGTSACATVSPDEMDASLSAMRAELQGEIQAGDQRVANQLGSRIDGVESRMAELEQDLQQMQQDFEVAIQQLEDELRFNVPIYFAFDDATVEAEDQALLNRFASVAQKYYPTALITVEGFTDPSGGEAYNLGLGQRRADAVMAYLANSTAITSDRLRAVSYGENTERLVMPEGMGPGTQGWQNRRVVLVIDHDGQAPAMTSDEAPGSTD